MGSGETCENARRAAARCAPSRLGGEALATALVRWLALGHFRWQPELTLYTHGCLRKRPACRRALRAAATRR